MTRAQIANMDQALFHYSSDLCTERVASEQAWQAIRPARNETSLGYLGLVMIQVTNWPCNKQGPYLRALKRNRVWIQRPLGKYPSIAPQFCLLGGDLPRCVMQRDWLLQWPCSTTVLLGWRRRRSSSHRRDVVCLI